MSNNILDLYEFALVGDDCFVGFLKEPTLQSLAEARELLNQITDDLIKAQLLKSNK